MSFRQFGGMNYAAKHNIVGSNYNTSNNLLVTQNVGQSNSYINFLSDISGNINFYGDLDLSGNLNISGDIDCSGNINVSGDFDLSGNLNVSGDIDCSGNINVYGDVDLSGNLNVSGDIDCSGNTTVAGTLDVAGDTTLTGNLMTIGTANPPTCPASSAILTTDNSNKLPSTSWVIGYVASVPPVIPSNLTLNNLNIVATSGNGAGAGFQNVYNTNGRISFSGSGGNNNGDVNAFVASKYIQFTFNNGGILTPSGAVMKYTILFTFFTGSNWGETRCSIDFFPNRWTQGQQTGNQLYNINNKIDGDGNYNYTNATYAPNGRQYWTYNQSFSGVSGPNALFIPHNGFFNLYFCIPDNSYIFSGSIQAFDTTAVSTGSQGITLEVI